MTNRIQNHMIIFSAVLVGCFFVFGCANDEKKIEEFFSKKLGVDEATEVETYYSQGGKMKARLLSPQMYRYHDTVPRVIFPNSLHVDFFDDSLKIESQLDALYGRYLESQNKVFLKDSVIVFNNVGDTLHCEELWWDQQQQKFYTDKAVRIYKKDMILVGVGLSAPQDFKTVEIYNLSNSIIRVSDSQFDRDTTSIKDTTSKRITTPLRDTSSIISH
jgi:LPS export ABC transporter protein LptC